MSAFVVSNQHINALVRWACRHQVTALHGNPSRLWAVPGQEQETADELLAENVKSYEHRYSQISNGIPAILYDAGAPLLSPVEALKAMHCLEYQSCEHPDWEESLAHAICKAIESKAISCLPGYSEAPWCI